MSFGDDTLDPANTRGPTKEDVDAALADLHEIRTYEVPSVTAVRNGKRFDRIEKALRAAREIAR